ncbi:MAG: hypothetical protein R6X12_05275 [bacterium]
MKAVKLAMAFALVAAIFCGGQKAEAPKAEDPTAGMPAFAFEPITETEGQKFFTALPGVAAALKAAEYAPEEKEGEEIPAALNRVVGGMEEVAGVKEALEQSGTSWAEFGPTMHKVMAASAAFTLDMAVSMSEQLSDDTEEGKEMMAEIEKAKAFCAKVPQENRQFIVQNMDKLEALNDVN